MEKNAEVPCRYSTIPRVARDRKVFCIGPRPIASEACGTSEASGASKARNQWKTTKRKGFVSCVPFTTRERNMRPPIMTSAPSANLLCVGTGDAAKS